MKAWLSISTKIVSSTVSTAPQIHVNKIVFHIFVFEQAVVKMVQEAFTYVEQTPDLEIKLKLIDTLRTVTAGKVSQSKV